MGDVRYATLYERVRESDDPVAAIHAYSDDDIVAALAGASQAKDPYLANVLATEALNRLRRTRAMIDHLGEGLVTADLEGRVVFANPAATRLLGRNDLAGHDLHAAVHGRPCERARCLLPAVLEGALGVRTEEDGFVRGDGDTLPVAYTAAPIREEGEVVGVVLCFQDASEMHAAREVTRRSEERYRTLVERSPVPMAVHRDGRLVFVNAAGLALLGAADRAAVEGRSVLDFVDPVDRPLVVERMRRTAAGGEALPAAQERLLRVDGTPFTAEVVAMPIDFEGRPATQLILTDVTERARHLEELALRVRQQAVVAELGRLALRAEDLDRLLQAAVERVADTLGVEYAKVLELQEDGTGLLLRAGVGWKPGLVGRAIVSAGIESQAGYTLATKGPVVVADMQSERRFHGPQLLLDHGVVSGVSVVIQGERAPFGVLGAHSPRALAFSPHDLNFLEAVANVVASAVERARDEREIHALAADLDRRVRERTTELTAVNAELESFSYSVSHDLRAPLRGIEVLSLALEEEYGDRLDAAGREMARRLRAESRRLSELVNALLALGRVTRGGIEREHVDLGAVAIEVLGGLAARDPGRRVEAVVAPDLLVDADPRLVRVLLENLLGNAWKFTANTDHPRIEVGAYREGGETVFFVGDNGAGFDPSQAHRLFTPFARLHSVREYEGTGIGLATVQRIVRRHGGGIWAESRPGAGATFRFTLAPRQVEGEPPA